MADTPERLTPEGQPWSTVLDGPQIARPALPPHVQHLRNAIAAGLRPLLEAPPESMRVLGLAVARLGGVTVEWRNRVGTAAPHVSHGQIVTADMPDADALLLVRVVAEALGFQVKGSTAQPLLLIAAWEPSA